MNETSDWIALFCKWKVLLVSLCAILIDLRLRCLHSGLNVCLRYPGHHHIFLWKVSVNFLITGTAAHWCISYAPAWFLWGEKYCINFVLDYYLALLGVYYFPVSWRLITDHSNQTLHELTVTKRLITGER